MENSIDEKKKQLKEELETLRVEYKVELPKRIAEARAYGDLRENAEYDAARERQAFVKARIDQISHQMSQLNDLSMSSIEESKIGYGSIITVLEKETNARVEFTFVHPNEVNPSEGKISLSSPIGMALQNKTVGEEVVVNIPAGKKRYYIEKLTTLHGKTMSV
ncbi:MAG TPA: transcription elongation factor GreA [Spirochaetota bacterium]|nr:transcription elongation factor GreA [Spirochaetota bacterium]HNT09806.1 transcription elongation factor GreA [Spirochaetota bacterium]HNV46121.1 transcription elongation factor GreA [Spirochaetota bacterium]HOS40499.1 transcription elongation factor GreA [Spirochaetota bacterium]HPU87066.1 transcription elongation factor GreA [Spirochaetota bacterium]